MSKQPRSRPKGKAVKKSLSLTNAAWNVVQRLAKRDSAFTGMSPNYSLTASRLIERGAAQIPDGQGTFGPHSIN